MYKKILVPYDGSKYSDKAADHAIDLAALSGAKITFLHVTMLPSLVYMYHEPASAAINNAVQLFVETSEDTATRALAGLVGKAKKQGVDATYVHVIADPSEAILETAKRHKSNLIVMGSRGLRGIARIKALGSVTRRVVEYSDCPVLVVH